MSNSSKVAAPITPEELDEMKARQQWALEDVKGFYPQYSPVFIDALHALPRCIAEIERLRAVCEKEGVEWLPPAYDRTKVCHCSCPEEGACVDCGHEKQAPRDTYTKAEIDERMREVIGVLEEISPWWSGTRLRRKFLS